MSQSRYFLQACQSMSLHLILNSQFKVKIANVYVEIFEWLTFQK